MTSGADPARNAPLPPEAREFLNTMPDLATLQQKRDAINAAIEGCVNQETLLDLQRERKQCTEKIKAQRRKYTREYREGHFRRKNQHIVQAQLNGHDTETIAVAQRTSIPPKTCLEERQYLGNLEAYFPPWSTTVADNWAQGLRALQSLCGRVERKTQQPQMEAAILREKPKNGSVHTVPESDSTVADQDGRYAYRCDPMQCLFCVGDKRLAHEQRAKLWKPTHVLWRHVSTQHLKNMGDTDQVECPHPLCRTRSVVLKHKMHLLSHAQVEHNIRLQRG